MDKMYNRQKWISAALFLSVFLFTFVFFYCIHPIVILDSDDWQYISYVRPAVPYTGFWNPSRILPEILMPACGGLAAVLFRLGFDGYIESQIFVFAAVIALFIAMYVRSFFVLIRKKFSLSSSSCFLLSALFLLLHFLIFRIYKSDNIYMFWSYDATCYFYYTIPSVLCCTLVMFFESSGILDSFFTKEKLLTKSIVVVAVYFAVFSNLFNSVILAVYMAYDIIRTRKLKVMPCVILGLWLASLVFEYLGGRGSVSTGVPLDIRNTFSDYLIDFRAFSTYFDLLMLLSVGCAFVLCVVLKKKSTVLAESLRPHLFAFFAISVFEILLCAKVNHSYMLRPQVFFGVAFSIFMMICLCLAYILKEIPQTFIALPIILIVALSVTNTQEKTFAESNTMNLPWQQCVKIDNDLIDQVLNAQNEGKADADLEIMDTGSGDNWPHTDFITFGLERSLYKHGLTTYRINLTPQRSLEFNQRNGITISEFSEARN